MLPVVGWLIVLAACVLGAGWWFTRRGGRTRDGAERAPGGARSTQWADFSDTSPVADGAVEAQRRKRQALNEFVDSMDDNRPPSRFADTSPAAFQSGWRPSGPAALHPLSPSPVAPTSGEPVNDLRDLGNLGDPGARPTGSPPLDSWFADVGVPASAPLSPSDGAGGTNESIASRERVQRAMQDLAQGPVDQAWETLRGYLPPEGLRRATLETCERIAAAFEAERRFDAARDVYEYMADLDADWPEVRSRLMRARGVAQVQAVSAWGSVPPRAVPTQGVGALGRCVIDKQIGQGAMGAIYLAHEPSSGQRVAIKTMALAREFSGTELADARARFLREAEMAGRLQHPDIVHIIDAGESEGLAYIAMELVDGVDLSHHTQPEQLLPVPVVLRIVARVADALAYAHTRGVTHRDIKPDNIMFDAPREAVKVMDFGVAQLADASRTRTGVVLGTPTFMSPEQLSGQHTDGRSDLYSLGVTLFQLLTGQLPYRSDSLGALMRAIGQDTPPNVCSLRADLPPALGDVVALALQKHPATRYATGEQMAEDLRAILKMLPDSGPQAIDIPLG